MENTEGQKSNARSENNDRQKRKRALVASIAVVPAWEYNNRRKNKRRQKEKRTKERKNDAKLATYQAGAGLLSYRKNNNERE